MQREGTADDEDGRSDDRLGEPGGDDEESEERFRSGGRADADVLERPSSRASPAASGARFGRVGEFIEGGQRSFRGRARAVRR